MKISRRRARDGATDEATPGTRERASSRRSRSGAGSRAAGGIHLAGAIGAVLAIGLKMLISRRSVTSKLRGAMAREPLGRAVGDGVDRSGDGARLVAAGTSFEATVDNSTDAVFMFDPDTLRLTYVNRSGADLVDVDASNLADRSILQLQPTTYEAGFRARLAEMRASPTRSNSFTDVLTRRDGREVPVDVVLHEVVLPDGSRTAILTAHDTSDRIAVQARLARIAGDERRQAAELRAVIQSMGEGVLVADPDGRISLANEAAATILQGDLPVSISDLEARLGVGPIGGIHRVEDDDPASVDRPLTVRIDQDRWLEITTHSADLAGNLTNDETRASRIIVLRDVTRAREAEAAREAFLGVLSHELRTPVTTIFGYSKVLRRPGHQGEQAEMLADIEVEADRLYRIVEDLLALSRVEGGITIDGEPLLVQHLIGPVVVSEAQRWGGITFNVEVPPDLPAVFGERTYVEQVLRNLVSNAGKYGSPDTVVTIEAEATPTDVVVRVLDRGGGILEDEADQLFELYYRSPTTAARVSGAGIGLYICRGLIQAMGGRIWARPRPGGGSEFGFSLSLAVEDSAAW